MIMINGGYQAFGLPRRKCMFIGHPYVFKDDDERKITKVLQNIFSFKLTIITKIDSVLSKKIKKMEVG